MKTRFYEWHRKLENLRADTVAMNNHILTHSTKIKLIMLRVKIIAKVPVNNSDLNKI